MTSKRKLKEQLERYDQTVWNLNKENDKLHIALCEARDDNRIIRTEIKKLIKTIFPSESFIEMLKLS